MCSVTTLFWITGNSLETSASHVTSSGIYPGYSIANAINKATNNDFVSDHSNTAWIQWEFAGHVIVTRVVVVQRLGCCAERFANVHFHLGNNSAIVGQVNDNPICAVFDGPGVGGGVDVILCEKNMDPGKYFAVQRIAQDSKDLGFRRL